MKSYIAGSAIFLILLILIFQWASDTRAFAKRTEMVNIVAHHAQQARMAGYFTPQIKNSLLKEIEEKTGTPRAEIQLKLTETKVCTRQTFNENQQISYSVKIPIRNVVAAAKLFNIPESDNMYWFPLEGKVSSEVLCDS